MTGTIQAMVGSRLLELARDARKGGPPCARKAKRLRPKAGALV